MSLSNYLNIIDQKKRSGIFIITRVGLGVSLTLKGIQFIQNNSLIRNVFADSLILQKYLWLQTIIPWVNVLGGVFIIIGLFTRIASFIQIPILLGAIFFVDAQKGVYEGQTSLWFSLLLLFFLFVFLIQGAGKPSLDMALRKKINKQ